MHREYHRFLYTCFDSALEYSLIELVLDQKNLLPKMSKSTKKEEKSNANCNQVILDHFWHVCGPSEDRRLKSTLVILGILDKQTANKQYEDLAYCVDRLIRGLTSSRDFARHGVCVLLTEIFKRFKQINISKVLESAEKEYGKLKEDSDSTASIAWALLLTCLYRSKRITIDLDPAILMKFYSILCLLGCKKSYVEVIVCELMEKFFDIFKKNESFFAQTIFKHIMAMHDSNKLFKTYMLLLTYQKFPHLSKNAKLVEDYYRADAKADFQKIIKLIKETTRFSPIMHPINELLIDTVKRIDPDNLTMFYTKLIESIFKTDMVKTSLGFDIIPIMLKYAKNGQIKAILQPVVIRNLIQTLSNKKHPLYNVVLNFKMELAKFSYNRKDNPELQLELAKCFIEIPGSINFDELSRSHFLLDLLRTFDDKALVTWIEMLKDSMIKQTEITSTDFHRIRCLQQMVQLVKYCKGDVNFLHKNLRFLLVHAFFDIDACKKPLVVGNEQYQKFHHPFTLDLRMQFRNSFQNILGYCLAMAGSGQLDSAKKLENQIEVYAQLRDTAMGLLEMPDVKLVHKSVQFEKFRTVFVVMSKKVQTIAMKKCPDKCKPNVFRLLYLHFMIDSLENFHELQHIIPDFNECVDRALIGKAFTSAAMVPGQQSEKKDPVWSDVLTELFVSLIHRSKCSRSIILLAFKHIAPFVTEDGVQVLCDVLLQDDLLEIVNMDIGGGRISRSGSDDENEEQDDDDDDDDDESDSASNKNEEDEDDDDEEEDDDDDDDDESVEENNDNVQVDERFKMNLINALGSAAAINNNNDEDDEDVPDLTDEQMLKLDESLSKVFQEKFGKKKRETEEKNLLLSFKLRILDLISTLISNRSQIDISMVITLVMSVINFLKVNSFAGKSQKQSALVQKCAQVLLQISNVKPVFADDVVVDREVFEEIFATSLQMQYKCAYSKLRNSLTAISCWVTKLAKHHLPKQLLDFLHVRLEKALRDFFEMTTMLMKPEHFKLIIAQVLGLQLKEFLDSRYFQIIFQYSLDETKTKLMKRIDGLNLILTIIKSCKSNKMEQTENFIAICSKLMDKTLNEIKRLKEMDKFKLKDITFINAMMKLMIVLNLFELRNADKLDAKKTELLKLIQSLRKDFRKNIDKPFLHKLRSIEAK